MRISDWSSDVCSSDLATAQFAIHRDVPSTSVRIHLEALGTHIEGTRFPRATIIRRRGTSRRRAYTTLGIAACVGALLGAGAIVHRTGGAPPHSSDERREGKVWVRNCESRGWPHT